MTEAIYEIRISELRQLGLFVFDEASATKPGENE